MANKKTLNLLKTALLMIACLAAVLSFGCGKKNANENGFSINQQSVRLKVGEQTVISVVGEVKGDITFSSSEPLVASVDGNGTVKALSVGTCTIYVVNGENQETCAVTVIPAETTVEYVPTLTVGQDEAELLNGSILSVKAYFSSGETDIVPESVVWASSDTSVVAVIYNGLNATLSALNYGTATVTVQATYENELYERTIDVYVKADANIFLNKSKMSLFVASLSEGQNVSDEVSVLSAEVSGTPYSGAFTCEKPANSKVDVEYIDGKFVVTAKSVGEETIKIGYLIPGTAHFVYGEVQINVKKGEKAYDKEFYFDVENDSANYYTLASSFADLKVVGEYDGIYAVSGVKLNKGNNLGFSYDDVKSGIDTEGNYDFYLETTVAKYTVHSKIVNRTNGWTKISTFADLDGLREKVNAQKELSGKYYLGSDVDCSGQEFIRIEANLTGIIDGNGHRIINLKINKPTAGWGDSNYPCVFITCLYGGGIIRNVSFDGFGAYEAKSENLLSHGALADVNFGTIENVVMRYEGNLAASCYGIARRNRGGTIKNCIVDTTAMTLYKGENKQRNSVSTFITVDNGNYQTNIATVENCYAYSLSDVEWQHDNSGELVKFTVYGLINGLPYTNGAWYVTAENANYENLSGYSGVKVSQEAFAEELSERVQAGELSKTAYGMYCTSIGK